MRKRLLVLVVLALGLSALLALWAAGNVSKLSAYGFKGTSGDVSLVVDYDLARYRGGEKYIPILIWLGHTERKTLYADRGSFTLTDPKGNKQALAAADEVTTQYGPNMITTDYGYIGRLPDYGGMVYLACMPIPGVCFFPNPSGRPGVLYDHVELPNRTVCQTLLYFPNPAGKEAGTYTFTYDDPKSKTHIEVPFTIPWDKK